MSALYASSLIAASSVGSTLSAMILYVNTTAVSPGVVPVSPSPPLLGLFENVSVAVLSFPDPPILALSLSFAL